MNNQTQSVEKLSIYGKRLFSIVLIIILYLFILFFSGIIVNRSLHDYRTFHAYEAIAKRELGNTYDQEWTITDYHLEYERRNNLFRSSAVSLYLNAVSFDVVINSQQTCNIRISGEISDPEITFLNSEGEYDK